VGLKGFAYYGNHLNIKNHEKKIKRGISGGRRRRGRVNFKVIV